jgi:predicted phage tail protein
MAASVSGSRVTLTWQAPTTGGAPTHYLLYVGTRSGYSNVVSAYNVGNVLRVSGDLPRGTYYARVRAANNAGTSLNSNEARFSIGRKLRSPSGFTVTWSGTTATMSWVAPSADSAEDVPTNYVIQAGTTPGASDVAQLSVGNTTRFTTDVPSGNYYVRVIAQNALGESDPSNEIEVRAPGAPQAPTSLMSVSPNGIVDLRWTASAGGYAATGYVIEAGSAPGRADLATLNVGNVTSFQTTAPPGVYYVRVRAINARGMSLPSNEVIVRR